MKCSRCGKEMNELVICINQKIDVYKITEQGTFAATGNVSEPTNEYICPSCFDRYADCINKLNEEYNGEYLINMVDVVDDIQYGEDA